MWKEFRNIYDGKEENDMTAETIPKKGILNWQRKLD